MHSLGDSNLVQKCWKCRKTRRAPSLRSGYWPGEPRCKLLIQVQLGNPEENRGMIQILVTSEVQLSNPDNPIMISDMW